MSITSQRIRWGLMLLGALIVIFVFVSHRPTFSDDQQMGSRALALLFFGLVSLTLGAGWEQIKKHPVRYLALLLGIYWLLFVYHVGLRFSPDAGYYLNYALNMHYAGDYYVNPVWPPLYPLLIHAFMFFNAFPGNAVALLGGIMMTGSLVAFALILEEFSSSHLLNALLVVALFLFPGFIFIHTIALSEVPFAFFILLSLLFIIRHNCTGKVIDYLVAAVSVACIVLTRYSGVAFVGSFFLYTLFYVYRSVIQAGEPRAETYKYLGLNAISYVPVMIYGLVNLDYFQVRLSSTRETDYEITVFRPISAILESLSGDLGIFLGLVLLAALALFLMLLSMNSDRLQSHSLVTASYILLSFALYFIFLVVIALRVNIFPIDTRYLAPVYPSLFIFAVVIYQNLRNKVLEGKRHLFFDWGFRTVLLVLLFSFAGDYAVKMEEILLKQYADRAYHYEDGFSLSPSSIQLSQYIDEKLAESDMLLVTGTEFYPGSGRQSQLHPSLFYRQFTVASFPHGRAKFEDVAGFDFSIAFADESRLIRHYQVDISSLDALVTSVKQALVDEELDTMLLFVVEDDERLDEALASVEDSGISIDEDRFIDPYRVYRVNLLVSE